ncbi:glycoside hydrolase family 3 protein [Baudoinia panamericana UAMH 10762]|uniref:beta-glucosidase n=1 Tax=Baudoinia panamericana (strain UAMH 10762) TaxID=717646 RepID=M2LBN5_BAUPA|nr:glycoside hydrolase family 3 protein [Baudoinia panamericana UAMH 10762]EMC91282.1 glycoside hydrolase family 3 protein [Baudoinia panamericana UAMH 10762]
MNWTSPIVYPSPQGYGAGNWSDAYRKAEVMVTLMTLEEMNNVTLGVVDSSNGCVGISGSAPRLGFPGFCLHDAGNGVRNTDGVSGFASGIHIGASWNATLAYERAQFMGAEFKRKGVNVALGPVVGPIGRIAEGGRNWEAFAADPYLDGILGAQSVVGLQESVIASVKHFVAYEQETNRNPIGNSGGTVLSTSANLDDRTMHELYLWPFQDLVYAGAGCVMCSYNRINNTYACENSKAMNGLLKGELDFQGFVVSDWVGQHSGMESANAGLDMAMPTTTYWNERQLENAVNTSALNRTRLADMATRIIATWYQFGQDSALPLGAGMPPNILLPHNYTDAKDPASRPSLLQQAVEGHVLVKNVNNALPLQQPKVLSIFGYDAAQQDAYVPDGSFWQQNWEAIGLQPLQLNGIASNNPVSDPPEVMNGTLTVGGGSGSNSPAYLSSPYDAIQARAYNDGTAIFYDFVSGHPNVVTSSDACLVFINEYASEVWDRPGLSEPNSNILVSNVAASCNNTIVVIHNAGIRLVDAWIDNPNVTAAIFAHLPGQDAGRAIAQILYGDVSPSGRLPYTVAMQPSDYGNLLGPCQAHGSLSPQCHFSEGVNVDYRAFLARNVTPRYEFGYGLTYTTFNYSNLQIAINATVTAADTVVPVYTNGTTNNNGNNTAIGNGGLESLFGSVGLISASITNTGAVAAAEVAQLYLKIPTTYANASNPATRVLRGFEKLTLQPNATAQVSFNLRLKDVSIWNVTRQEWIVPSGEFSVFVGKSVLDTPLVGSFTI